MRIEVEKDEVVAPRDFVPLGGLSRSVVEYVNSKLKVHKQKSDLQEQERYVPLPLP